MIISKKIKTIDNKIEQNEAQCNSDRETAKTWTLTSGNVSKYEFLTDTDVVPEENLLQKAAAIKIFEYSPLGSELKKQTKIQKKKKTYQDLDKV